MFGRVAIRATRAARVAGPSKVARATFSAGSKLRSSEYISETEVASVSFDGGEARASTLKVGEKTEQDSSRVVPLSQEAFKRMTPTMQKGSIMGKVVIVTGYVLSPLTNLCLANGKFTNRYLSAVLEDWEITWLVLALRQVQKP
jgi:hypothetical protein